MKIGARIAHLAIAAGMIRSTIIVMMMKPISSQTAPMSALLEDVAELHGGDLRHVGEVEVGDELRDQQEQEEQARQARPRTW